jgi:hypothetical protein
MPCFVIMKIFMVSVIDCNSKFSNKSHYLSIVFISIFWLYCYIIVRTLIKKKKKKKKKIVRTTLLPVWVIYTITFANELS